MQPRQAKISDIIILVYLVNFHHSLVHWRDNWQRELKLGLKSERPTSFALSHEREAMENRMAREMLINSNPDAEVSLLAGINTCPKIQVMLANHLHFYRQERDSLTYLSSSSQQSESYEEWWAFKKDCLFTRLKNPL